MEELIWWGAWTSRKKIGYAYLKVIRKYHAPAAIPEEYWKRRCITEILFYVRYFKEIENPN